jgi:hypothetical protein
MMPTEDKFGTAVTGQQELILVPRRPTQAMIKAAWASAADENAALVWRDMIDEWELSGKERELGRR